MNAEVHFGLKIGAIEVDFDGSSATFETKIEPIVKDLIAFGKANPLPVDSSGFAIEETKKQPTIPMMTVKSVASKIGGDSGSALLYATIATLAVIKKKETATRQEINDEMKLAVGYYKPSYTSNLSNYIERLCEQGVIIETSKDTYAVQSSALAEMEQRLAH